MKQFNFQSRFLILLGFLTIGINHAWGDSVTFTGADYKGKGGSSGSGGEASATKNGITITSSKAYYSSDTEIREYTGTIKFSGAKITKIELTSTASGTNNNGPSKIGKNSGESGSYSYSGKIGTWENNEGDEEVVLKCSAQFRWSQIVVTYVSAKPYTVNFYKADGTLLSEKTESSAGAGVTTPVAQSTTCSDWTFAGWTTDNITEETSDKPTKLTAANTTFHPSENCNMYPVFTQKTSELVPLTEILDLTKLSTSPYASNDFTIKWGGSFVVGAAAGSCGFKSNSNMTITMPTDAKLTKVSIHNSNTWGTATVVVYAGTSTSGTNCGSMSSTSSGTDQNVSIQTAQQLAGSYYLANTKSGNAWVDKVTLSYMGYGDIYFKNPICAPTYAITTNNPANGSIKFSTDGTNWSNTIADQEADAGVYFKLVPNAGYEVQQGSVDITSTEEVLWDLVEGKANTYYMIMPASDVTVSATFSCATPTFKTNLTEQTIEKIQNLDAPTLSVEKNESWATYQWQSSANSTKWDDIANATNTSYTPSVATIGTTYYRCLLKNGVSPCETSTPSKVVTLNVVAPSKCEIPTFSLEAKTYTGAQSVELACVTEGAKIYYTTDDTEPSTSSTEYTGAINVFKTMTIRAIAAKDGIESSEEGTATYIIQYTVTFNMQDHGQQVQDQKVGYEDLVSEPTTTSITGWTFGGWFKEGACNNQWNFATDKVTDHTTLFAKWTEKKFDVKFYNNGDLVQTYNIQDGQTIGTLPTLTSADAKDAFSKTFVGWTEEEVTTWQDQAPAPITSTKVVEGELTLNAVWAKEVGVPSTDYSKISAQSDLETNDYVIGYKYKSNGTHFVMKNAVNGSYTTQIAGVAMSPSSNKFTSPNAMYVWHFEKQSDGSYTIYNAAVNKYLSASADVVTQEVHLADVGTKFNVINTTISSQNLWQLQLANATDYYVHGYSSGSGATATYYFKVSDSPATSYNKENYITLLYKNESTLDYTDYITHSSASPLESITLNTTGVKKNYFVGETFTSANLSATAKLEDGIEFPIEYNDLTISTPDLTSAGETVTVEYTFNGATQSATYDVNAYSVTVNSVYTDRVNDESVDGNTYNWNAQTHALTFTKQAHYKFNGITNVVGATLDGEGLSYTLSNPTADVTLTATWQRLFTLTYNGKGGSTPDAVVDEPSGTEITLSTPMWAGYDFVGWYDNEAYDGSALTSPYTITADATIFAKWSEIMPTEIKVSSSEVSLIVDGSSSEQKTTITATVEPSTALNKNIAWSVVEGNDVVSVSSEGIITSLKAGTATVRATSSRDASVYEEVSVTVHSLPQITWMNMDGTTYDKTTGTSAGKVGKLPSGTPTSCDATAYPYFRGWSAENFGKTTDNPETDFITVNTPVELDKKYTFHAVCAAGKEEIQTVFTETFDQCAGTGGNDGSWSGTIATGSLTSDNTGWTFAYGGGAKECAKFGKSSSGKGSAETPSITMSGDGTIILKAAAWDASSEGTTLNISATSGTVSPTSVTLKKAEWSEYEISITGVTTATKIKFEASKASSSRFFIDNVVVKAGSISYTTWATQCCTTPEHPLEITNTNLTIKTNSTLQLTTTEGNGATKVWASTNGAVATVDQNGIVTAESTGKATISVLQEAKDGYCAQYDEVEIEVIASNEFGIAFAAADGGTTVAKVNDTPTNKATKGTIVTITATPADDYNFTGWTVNAGGVTLADASLATTTFTMGEADVEITPSFTLKKFTVTLDAGTGDVETTSYTEDVHTVIELPAAAHCQPDVWAFQGWSETNVTEVSSDCPVLVDNNYEITKDITLYAIYKKADGGEKTIGYKISYQVNTTTYYASSGVSAKKMNVSTDISKAVVFGMTTTSGQSKLYQVDENGDAKAGTYIYLDSNNDLDQGAEGSTNGYLWTISMTGTHSIISVKKNDRCIAGRSGAADLYVVNASVANVDKPEGVSGNYFHHLTLIPVVKGAASYCTSPECVSLTWVNEMSGAAPSVTYPGTDGKLVLPAETPASCAPGLYSFVGWTATKIPTYKTSQQEIVTAETAAPEHATTYYAEFVSTVNGRYRTSCPETLYAITYKANGGEGEDYIQYSENKTNVTSYDGAAFSKTDCQLYQWNTVSDGTGTAYKPNSNIISIATIVGEGTTGTLYAQWTGELSVAGNVCLTSGKDIAVYTTAAAGNLITISCPAIDMVHHIRYKFLDSENQEVTTLKLCNDGTVNYNQITNIATDKLTGAYEQTFSICYTPTEYNQAATYTLLLEGVNQGGTTVFNSCTLSVTVRSLPEQFVIAVKKDNQWYAVPNVLATTASAAPNALPIEVDDNNNPTYAWLSDNTTAALYKSASRYEANQHRGAIRFQSVENDKYITASYAKDATSFYMPTGNSDAQQFYLNSTDCNVYKITLDPAEFIDKDFESRWICMSGTKIGWYRYDNETKNVYFLPIKAITEKIEVADEQTVSLSEYEVDETTTVIVHAGGILNADKVATIGTLQIEKTGDKSGQVFETETLTANNAYFDVTLNAQGMKWYDIAVPFTVDRLQGLSLPDGNKIPLNDVLVYSGAARAQNGANGSAWQYQDDGDLVPGVGYDIMFATNVTTVRFTKKADAQLNNEEDGSIIVEEFTSGSNMDANWNYIANNTLHYVNLGFEKEENENVVAQTYVPVSDSYIAYEQDAVTYLVGTPFFVQVDAADKVVWNIDETHSVLRAPAMTMNRVERFTLEMSANGEMTDRLFVSADENARDEYQIGKDVAKMGVSSTIAQMWINNYNTKLCANEAVLTNGQATYQLGVFVPKDGEYTIAITSAPENATLYLTIDGQVVWNLSESAYVANLTKGTHSEFGLLLIANEKVTPTNINGLKGNNKAQKIFKDYNIYILRDAQMYNTQGVKVQ